MDNKLIDFDSITHLLKKRVWIIVLITAISTFLGWNKATHMVPYYQARVKMFIGNSENTLDYYSSEEIKYYKSFVDTFQEIIVLDGYLNQALQKNNIDKNAYQVAGGLKVSMSENAPIITVMYQSADREGMEDIITVVCNELSNQIKSVFTEASPKIVENVRVGTIMPNKDKVITTGFIVGLVLSLGLVLVIDYFNDSIESKEQLEKLLHLPVIGDIPKEKGSSKGQGELVTIINPTSIWAESYKSLRTGIKYSTIDKELKTLVITSSVPDEGKSTVASNLAVTLSQYDERVLLIDCDLRKPTIHKKFSVSNSRGLTDLLVNRDRFEDVVCVINDRLNVLTAGTIPPNPAEIIDSKKLQDFINIVKFDYDYVILDAPPVLAVTDPQLLAGKVDATLLVVRAKKVKGKLIAQAYKELKLVNAKVIGSVLNGRERNNIDLYSKYYKT